MSAHTTVAVAGTALALVLTSAGGVTRAASPVAASHARPVHGPCLGCAGQHTRDVRRWRRANAWRLCPECAAHRRPAAVGTGLR
jgi:hypothetical protein